MESEEDESSAGFTSGGRMKGCTIKRRRVNRIPTSDDADGVGFGESPKDDNDSQSTFNIISSVHSIGGGGSFWSNLDDEDDQDQDRRGMRNSPLPLLSSNSRNSEFGKGMSEETRESLKMNGERRISGGGSRPKCVTGRPDCYYFSWVFLLFLLVLSEQGTIVRSVGGNNGSLRQRWQTALSNTGPFLSNTVEANSDSVGGGDGVDVNRSAGGTTTLTTTTPISISISPNRTMTLSSSTPSADGTNRTFTKLVSTASPPNSPTRHQHQQTRSVTSNINNSGSVSTYNNNRNNGKNLLSSGNNMASSGGSLGTQSTAAARKKLYESLGKKFTEEPLFENNTSINISVPVGENAYFRCPVKGDLGERSISFIRRRDWHILSTGKATYTNDNRFTVHTDGNEWTLILKYTQEHDKGVYECDVISQNGDRYFFMVNLIVLVPEVFILNGNEYHVEQGSTIELNCVIKNNPKVDFIFWFHNNERLIESSQGQESRVKIHENPARTQSTLVIRHALLTDSGNFTCYTGYIESASIIVYVSQASGLFSGDKIAAIQRRKSSSSSSESSSASSGSSSSSSTSSAPSTGHLNWEKKTHHLESSSSISTLFVQWLTTKMTRMRETFPFFLVISQSLVASCLLLFLSWSFLSTPEFLPLSPNLPHSPSGDKYQKLVECHHHITSHNRKKRTPPPTVEVK